MNNRFPPDRVYVEKLKAFKRPEGMLSENTHLKGPSPGHPSLQTPEGARIVQLETDLENLRQFNSIEASLKLEWESRAKELERHLNEARATIKILNRQAEITQQGIDTLYRQKAYEQNKLLAHAKKLEQELNEARELLSMIELHGQELSNDSYGMNSDYFNSVQQYLERTNKKGE